MGEDEPGHRSCCGHISVERWSRRSSEVEDSIGLSVVNGFLMVELGSSKDTTKTDCSVQKVLCSAAEIACKGRQDFYLEHDGGHMILIHNKIGQGMRVQF